MRNNIKFTNDYEYCEIIKNKDFIDIVDNIFDLKDKNIIILYQLSFELGLSLNQILKLKYRNIKNDYKNILFKDNGFQIYRALSFYAYSILKYHYKTHSLKPNDYLIFNEISNSPKKIRNYVCEKKIYDLFIKSIKNSRINKKKFLEYIKLGPKRKKINSINTSSKTAFFQKLWIDLNIFQTEKIYDNDKQVDNQINNVFDNHNNFFAHDEELKDYVEENTLKNENLYISEICQINNSNNYYKNNSLEESQFGLLNLKNLFDYKEDSMN